MNVTGRVKGCSQRLYNNMRAETKCCKWKVIQAVWKERAFPTADSHFACREMFFYGTWNVITVLTRVDHWTLSQDSSNQSKNSDSTSSGSYVMLTTYVFLRFPCGPFLLLIMCHIPPPTPTPTPTYPRWRAQIVKLSFCKLLLLFLTLP